jgi:hypothetical protein
MISKTIYQKLINNFHIDEIDFSKFGNGIVLKSIFDLLKGKSFKISKFQSEDIYQSIQFLPLSSYIHSKCASQGIAFNFFKMSIYSLLDLSPDSIHSVISSNYLHLKNERQLLDFILKKIGKNRSNLYLLPYIFGSAVTNKSLFPLINSLQFKEMNQKIFVFLKNCFKFGYLTSSPAQDIMSFDFENINYLCNQTVKLTQLYDSLPNSDLTLNPKIELAMLYLKNNEKERGFQILNELAKLGDPEAC